MNAGQWALSHPDLAAAVASAVEPKWLTLFTRPARARLELAFELRAIDCDLGWLGWIMNLALVVADLLTQGVQAGGLGSAWLVAGGAFLGVGLNAMWGYVRLLRDRLRTRRQLARIDAGGAA